MKTGKLIFVSLILSTLTFIGMDVNAQSTKVLMKTTVGDITLMFYDDTPMHRDNFVELVNKGYYNGLLFHRVIPSFMIQAGDPKSKNAKAGEGLGLGGPGYTVPAEFKPNRYHKKGALGAARQGDQVNPQKASNGSQFYIVVGKTWSLGEMNAIVAQGRPAFTDEQKKVYMEVGGYPPLDYEYTVYGEVVSGLDIVEKIAKVNRDPRNRPVKDIKIISAEVLK